MTVFKTYLKMVALVATQIISTISLLFVVDDYYMYYTYYQKHMSHKDYQSWSGSEFSMLALILFVVCQVITINLLKHAFKRSTLGYLYSTSIVIIAIQVFSIIFLKGETSKISFAIALIIFISAMGFFYRSTKRIQNENS